MCDDDDALAMSDPNCDGRNLATYYPVGRTSSIPSSSPSPSPTPLPQVSSGSTLIASQFRAPRSSTSSSTLSTPVSIPNTKPASTTGNSATSVDSHDDHDHDDNGVKIWGKGKKVLAEQLYLFEFFVRVQGSVQTPQGFKVWHESPNQTWVQFRVWEKGSLNQTAPDHSNPRSVVSR
ncbi:hypothetical protein EDB83DRAFT_2314585 [Lactarius deliciosus]|nr:hypothetical protein EDB83DRAFT_2314585 [Lactarius deliciosus]